MVRNISIHSWAATGRPFKNFSPYWNRSEVPCISIGRHAPILATKIHRDEKKTRTIVAILAPFLSLSLPPLSLSVFGWSDRMTRKTKFLSGLCKSSSISRRIPARVILLRSVPVSKDYTYVERVSRVPE